MPSEVEKKYDEEQARLRAELEGDSRKDIQVTAPKDPEVNPEVYKDVEPMIFRGFITAAAEMGDVYFVFKSLNHHEFELLTFAGLFSERRAQDASWNMFLAHCVFMVNGVNILPRRDEQMPRLSDLFASLPKDARAKVIRHVGELNRRAARAIALVEAYSMEATSRYRWMQLRGLELTSTPVTGIDGTALLGLNWAQQLWRAINQVEDRNDEHERAWENAKFVGSCMAGKGVSKVYQQDTERRRNEREDRLARKDRILREHVLGERVAENEKIVAGAVLTHPRTVEELADQLQRDLRGERDFHDEVVAAHEARVRAQQVERQAQIAASAEEARRSFNGQHVLGETILEGLTRPEADELMRSRKQLVAQAVARSQVAEQDERSEEFLDKWGLSESASGISTTDRDVSNVAPLPSGRRATSQPFRR